LKKKKAAVKKLWVPPNPEKKIVAQKMFLKEGHTLWGGVKIWAPPKPCVWGLGPPKF